MTPAALDLFPRANKFSHAAHAGIIPAVKNYAGGRSKTLSVMWANFPKPTHEKPSLLKQSDVKTFFHEFGHALHAILGATEMASFSGTSVKRDFVELPSQMLEEWLNDKQILQMISSHYKTGEPLPDQLITNMMNLKNVFLGDFIQRQAMLSLIALDLFGPGSDKDPSEICNTLYKQFSSLVAFDPKTHQYASFGHLTGYGAKYYGYLWSRVFAQDVFEQIKQYGLLNPIIGQKYCDEILSKGGSKDPNVLLENFLGRPPIPDAFLKDLTSN